MPDNISNHQFADPLIAWYQTAKRSLPWRDNNNPYHIWLSEVILQQTRVVQGLPYYLKFVNCYPTIEDLSRATESEVLRLWQGLGYYSRARNLLKTAKQIVDLYPKSFPTSYSQLIGLIGIGPYTAAAVASFSSNENVAVLDGNVFRVLARYLGIDDNIAAPSTRKIFQQAANALLPLGKAGEYNQAIMELGALICTPSKPACLVCPANNSCYAYSHKAQSQLPLKIKTIKRKTRYLHILLLQQDGGFYTKPRPAKDIWEGLHTFILAETPTKAHLQNINQFPDLLKLLPNGAEIQLISDSTKPHKLTHQDLHINIYASSIDGLNILSDMKILGYTLIPRGDLDALPKPVPLAKLLLTYSV